MLVRRLSADGQGVIDDQMDRLAVPRHEALVKKDGLFLWFRGITRQRI